MGSYCEKIPSRASLGPISDKKWPKGCPHKPNAMLGPCKAAHCNFPICEVDRQMKAGK